MISRVKYQLLRTDIQDNYTLLLFLLVTCSIKKLYVFTLPIIIIITLYQFYRVFKNKINVGNFFATYFYLYIYALVFAQSIQKTILVILLVFLATLMLIRRKKITFKKEVLETTILIFFGILTLNHCLFKPYMIGLDIFIHFLLIPLLFLMIKALEFKVSKIKAIKTFIYGVLVSLLMLSINDVFFKGVELKTNTFFATLIGTSHVYYGIFISITCCFILILHEQKKYIVNKIADVFILLFLLIILVYLGARIALITTLLCVVIHAYKSIKVTKLKKNGILIFLLVSIAFLVSETPRVQSGIENIKKVYVSFKENNKKDLVQNSWRNMYQRFLITKYSFKEIQKQPWLGIGMHNVKSKISHTIIDDGYKYLEPINSHNQYLHVLVGMGIVGLLSFFYLLWNMYIRIHEGTYFFLFFLIIMITESVLVRGKGIALFLFFGLIFSLKKEYLSD